MINSEVVDVDSYKYKSLIERLSNYISFYRKRRIKSFNRKIKIINILQS